MGEAKRRKKLDPNFGQNYPASEENWVFTTPSEHSAIGDLNACLQMAGLTTPEQYQSTYVDPLSEDSLSEDAKFLLIKDRSRFSLSQELYQSFFDQAVRFGEVYIDININQDQPSNLEELDIEEDDDYEDEPFYNHIAYNPKIRSAFSRS